MSLTDNLLDPVEEPYRRQMTSYRRSRSAILGATKNLIALHGLQATTMIEIADTAEVSRATLYNHFRSKESVMQALLEFEINRILECADSESSPTRALARISIEISTDLALATMRSTDPALLTQLLSAGTDPLWQQVHAALVEMLQSTGKVELALRWLIGQVFAPLTPEQSARAADAITA